MPEWCPNDRGGGGSEVAGVHQPGFVGGAAGITAETEGIGHRDGIGGFCDGGVEQHGVVAELERLGRMRRRADAGIDHQRDIRQALAQQFQRVAVGDAAGPTPIGAAQGMTTLQPASTRRFATERSSVQ